MNPCRYCLDQKDDCQNSCTRYVQHQAKRTKLREKCKEAKKMNLKCRTCRWHSDHDCTSYTKCEKCPMAKAQENLCLCLTVKDKDNCPFYEEYKK